MSETTNYRLCSLLALLILSSINQKPVGVSSTSAASDTLAQTSRNRLKQNVSRFEATIGSMCFSFLKLSRGVASTFSVLIIHTSKRYKHGS